MKPCPKRCKQITWLAIDALDTAQADELDRHFQECIGCRGYFDEIRLVQQRVSSLPSLVSSQNAAELSPVRDGRLSRQPTSHRGHDCHPRFQVSHRLRWLLAFSGASVAALILWFTGPERVRVSPPGAAMTTEISSNRAARDFLPSFAHYRAIGIQSLDRLDDLLAQQAQKAPHSPPCPTAGALDPADLPD